MLRMSRIAPGLGAVALVLALPATGLAQAPAGPPGPPPGNGTQLPAPPGTVPQFVPPGTPATVPGGATGPGLLSGSSVAFNKGKRGFLLPLACQGNGTVSFTARRAGRGTLAKTRYRCAGNRTRARLTVTRKVAKQIVRRKTLAARATVKQAGKTAKLDFVLRAGGGPVPTAGFWTDGHMLCSPDGGATPQAYIAEPDFTTQNPTRISTRAWLAWYTNAGGWHWLGTDGENRARWETWTATVGGVEQFHPDGAPQPTPFTWGPLTVPPGQGIYTVGVYEIVYWVGGLPQHRWEYVNAGETGAAAAGGGNLYCAYP